MQYFAILCICKELEEIEKKQVTAIFLDFDVLSYEQVNVFVSYALLSLTNVTQKIYLECKEPKNKAHNIDKSVSVWLLE